MYLKRQHFNNWFSISSSTYQPQFKHSLKNVLKIQVSVAQSCPTLCDSMDCSLPGSLIHGIFQARVLEWVAISFSNNRVLLSHKNEWNNAICSSMVGPWDYHTKWRKSERERQIPYDLTYMWTLKYDTNELTYKTETDSHSQAIPPLALFPLGNPRSVLFVCESVSVL